MLHYENDDYECAADPFCPPAFLIRDGESESDYMPGYDDGEWDCYVSEADEIEESESDYMPGYDDGEWEDMCGEEDFA